MNRYMSWLLPTCLLLLISCASHKVRPSLSEIDRPLFPPNNYWQTSTGIGIDREIRSNYYYAYERNWLIPIRKRTYLLPVISLQCPSYSLHPNVDFALPLMLRYHFAREIEVRDSIERISGVNIAFVNALTSWSYSPEHGTKIFAKHTVPVKVPLSYKTWFEAEPGIYYTLPWGNKFENHFSGNFDIPLSVGYQFSERWSCKGTLQLIGYYEHFQTADEENFDKWGATWNSFDLDIHIPIETKYVFNRNCEMSFMVKSGFYDKNSIGVQSAVWCTLTW